MKESFLIHVEKISAVAKEFWMPISTVAAVISAGFAYLSYVADRDTAADLPSSELVLECQVENRSEAALVKEWPTASNYPSVVVSGFGGGEIMLFVWGEGQPSLSSKTDAQRKLTALRAAELVAKRALAEWVGGGEITFHSEVIDFSLSQDWIRSSFEGMVPPVARVHADYDGGAGIGKVLLATSCHIKQIDDA